MAPVKLPIEPLLAHFPTMGEMGRVIGVDRTRISRAARSGGIALDTAERWADAAGLHPASVWPEYLSLVAEKPGPMRECAAEGCTNRFGLKHRGSHRRYCCDNCRDRTNARARYQSDPLTRVRKRAAARDYYGRNREAEIARTKYSKDQAKRRAS